MAMTPQPLIGVALHALGGLAAGSFYIPYKRVRGWAWESYWIVGGCFTWLVMPWIAARATSGDVVEIFRNAPVESLRWTFIFGALWGVGGLTFGLSLRYLGMSLGMAMSLGFCALFGTVLPPIYEGKFAALVRTASGQMILSGLAVCLAGIAVCAAAGRRREAEMSAEARAASIGDANYALGVAVAVFAGVMSACFAFAMSAGGGIAATAESLGVDTLHRNQPVIVLLFWGGFLTNFVWCVILNLRNRSLGDYVNAKAPLANNYFFSALAGTIAYLEFLFYGMGTTKMGEYDFSSWTIHMAFIIVFSNVWGLLFREWSGTSARTRAMLIAGIAILATSTGVVGYGNYLQSQQPSTESTAN